MISVKNVPQLFEASFIPEHKLKFNPQYYLLLEGDDLKTDDPLKAIEMFEMVVDLETKRGDVVKWYVIYVFM